MSSEDLVAGLVWYVVFLLSTTCHEAAHAWVAQMGGDHTAALGGQVSLDPIPHIRREPFGMVVFPILTYVMGGWMMGWASAPYDPRWAYQYPKRAAVKSLAGPAANFSLAILAGILIHIGIWAGLLRYPESISFMHVVDAGSAGFSHGVATFLSLLFSLNLLLGTFNLLPLPPLDGFGAVPIFLPEDTARRFLEFGWKLGSFSMIGLLLAWQVFGSMFHPVFEFSLRVLYPG
jgi:Zn-dependent protease